MLELWQTEWCPASRRVRQRLTELGIDYFTRQVPVEKNRRGALREATGSDTIPVVRLEDGRTMIGAESIFRFLDHSAAEPPEAEAHRLKAAQLWRVYLEEECECLQRATH
jgi:glutathione S-transferase